jgi:hypothetical protein
VSRNRVGFDALDSPELREVCHAIAHPTPGNGASPPLTASRVLSVALWTPEREGDDGAGAATPFYGQLALIHGDLIKGS